MILTDYTQLDRLFEIPMKLLNDHHNTECTLHVVTTGEVDRKSTFGVCLTLWPLTTGHSTWSTLVVTTRKVKRKSNFGVCLTLWPSTTGHSTWSTLVATTGRVVRKLTVGVCLSAYSPTTSYKTESTLVATSGRVVRKLTIGLCLSGCPQTICHDTGSTVTSRVATTGEVFWKSTLEFRLSARGAVNIHYFAWKMLCII